MDGSLILHQKLLNNYNQLLRLGNKIIELIYNNNNKLTYKFKHLRSRLSDN